jgi:hypothetical protein
LPKGGVFRGGPNEGDDPGLDVREEGVLLGLVEPVNLVQEQDRVPLEQGRLVLGLLYHIPGSNLLMSLDWIGNVNYPKKRSIGQINPVYRFRGVQPPKKHCSLETNSIFEPSLFFCKCKADKRKNLNSETMS